jgi:hypothetical protein
MVRKSIDSRNSFSRWVPALFSWRNRPLPVPRVSSDFEDLPLFSRTVESLRYNFASFEYWISPGGGLREMVGKIVGLGVLGGLGLGVVCLFISFLDQTQLLLVSIMAFLLLLAVVIVMIRLLPRVISKLTQFLLALLG